MLLIAVGACRARASSATWLRAKQGAPDDETGTGKTKAKPALMPKRRVKPRIERSADDDQQCSSDEEDYFLDAVLGKAEIRLAGKGKDEKTQPAQGREEKDKPTLPSRLRPPAAPPPAAPRLQPVGILACLFVSIDWPRLCFDSFESRSDAWLRLAGWKGEARPGRLAGKVRVGGRWIGWLVLQRTSMSQ